MSRFQDKDKVNQVFQVKTNCELLNFLLENKVQKSKNATQSVLKRKLVNVNGKLVTKFDHPLKPGDRVEIMKYDQSKKVKKIKGLTIIYEDDSIIIIDKQAGLLSVATNKEIINNANNILSEYVRKSSKNAKIFVVQRLEREISGLMIFAKTLEAQVRYKKNWDYMVPNITYSGVVEGSLALGSFEIHSWLTDNKNFKVFSNPVDNGGLEARTACTVLDSNHQYSLLNFFPKTRHRNQIRAQMEQEGTPIVGDKKYGAKTNPLKRCILHISYLAVKHPVNGKLMEFRSELPAVAKKLTKEKQVINQKNIED